jgi:hypothetical protein
MKYCNKCSTEQASEAFYRSSRNLDGLASLCKACNDGYVKQLLKSDPEYRARHQEVVNRYHRRIHEEIYKLLGDACRNCGNADRRVLELDHINNDGYLERPLGRANGGGSYKRDLQVRKHPAKFQILCANCHAIKTFEHRKSLECKTGVLSNTLSNSPIQPTKETND